VMMFRCFAFTFKLMFIFNILKIYGIIVCSLILNSHSSALLNINQRINSFVKFIRFIEFYYFKALKLHIFRSLSRLRLFVLFYQSDTYLLQKMQSWLIDVFVDWSHYSSLTYFAIQNQLCSNSWGKSNCNAHSSKSILLPNLYQATFPFDRLLTNLYDKSVLHGHQISLSCF